MTFLCASGGTAHFLESGLRQSLHERDSIFAPHEDVDVVVLSCDPTKEEVHGPATTQPELDGGGGTNRSELIDEFELSITSVSVIHCVTQP
jgi:hypothetical protein